MSTMLKYTLLGAKFRYKVKKTLLALKELRDLDKKQEGATAIIKTKVEEEGEGGEKEEEKEEKKETLHDTEFKSITHGNQFSGSCSKAKSLRGRDVIHKSIDVKGKN